MNPEFQEHLENHRWDFFLKEVIEYIALAGTIYVYSMTLFNEVNSESKAPMPSGSFEKKMMDLFSEVTSQKDRLSILKLLYDLVVCHGNIDMISAEEREKERPERPIPLSTVANSIFVGHLLNTGAAGLDINAMLLNLFTKCLEGQEWVSASEAMEIVKNSKMSEMDMLMLQAQQGIEVSNTAANSKMVN